MYRKESKDVNFKRQFIYLYTPLTYVWACMCMPYIYNTYSTYMFMKL